VSYNGRVMIRSIGRFHTLMAFALCLSALFIIVFSVAEAQVKEFDIAQRYDLADENFEFGDIVVYDRDALTYRLGAEHGDANVFGVTLEAPTLLLDDGTDNVPVVRSGETLVNVVTANGPIAAGDYITTSSARGKGERANPEDAYLVGIALTAYSGLPEEVVGEIEGLSYGRIPVLLSVGHVSKVEEMLTGAPAQTSEALTEATILNVIQYIVAAFVAVGSVFIAFRNFGSNIKTGIDSIGRNPLAKSSIQSMVVLNVVLIILVSLGGLFMSVAILLLPI